MMFNDIRDLFRKRNTPRSLSLVEQVQQAEENLLYSRTLIGVQVTRLNTVVRQRMTSPGSLLWAAGLGFMASEMTKRRVVKSRISEENSIPTERPNRIQMVLRYVAVARPLIATLTSFLAKVRQHSQDSEADSMQAQTPASAMSPNESSSDSSNGYPADRHTESFAG